MVEWQFNTQNFVKIMLIYCTRTSCSKSHDFHSVFRAKFLQFTLKNTFWNLYKISKNCEKNCMILTDFLINETMPVFIESRAPLIFQCLKDSKKGQCGVRQHPVDGWYRSPFSQNTIVASWARINTLVRCCIFHLQATNVDINAGFATLH